MKFTLGDDQQNTVVSPTVTDSVNDALRDVVLHGTAEEQETNGEPWEDITAVSYPVFPFDCIPERWSRLTENVSANGKYSRIYAVCGLISAMSHCLVGCSYIHYGDHTEPVLLYNFMVGLSGTRKSSAFKLSKPINDMLIEVDKQYIEDGKAAERKKKSIQLQIKHLKAEKGNHSEEVQELRKELVSIAENPPYRPISFHTDTTAEALLQDMAICNGRGILHADQASVVSFMVNGSTGRGNSNIDIFLKSVDGSAIANTRKTDRINGNGGRVVIPHPYLSILLGIQPQMVKDFCTDRTAADRGLVQRFMFFINEPVPMQSYDIDVALDTALLNEWYGFIKTLFERLQLSNAGKHIDFRLDSLAHNTMKTWQAKWTAKAREYGSYNPTMHSYYAKAHGKCLRLAAILTMMRQPYVSVIDDEYTVTDDDVSKAVRIMNEYILPSAKSLIVQSDDASNLDDMQRCIVEKLQKDYRNQTSFYEQKLYSSMRCRIYFKGKDGHKLFRDTLDKLEQLDFIRKQENIIVGVGRPAIEWQISPYLNRYITR